MENIDIANKTFYANNFVLKANGREFIVDFTCVAPRYESGDSTKPYVVAEHNSIVLNIVLFKELMRIGGDYIKALEDQFGDVATPEFIEKLNQDQQKALKEAETNTPHENNPSYYG